MILQSIYAVYSKDKSLTLSHCLAILTDSGSIAQSQEACFGVPQHDNVMFQCECPNIVESCML